MIGETIVIPKPESPAAFAEAQCSALVALKELRDAITDFGGHGMPGFIDRAVAYGVIRQADEVLKREMPNVQAH